MLKLNDILELSCHLTVYSNHLELENVVVTTPKHCSILSFQVLRIDVLLAS